MGLILQFEHVNFAYGDRPVLEDVNLAIEAGESIGIIGPNGGGKTTLLKLMMGFLKPNSGTIKQMASNIGYVPQVMRFDRQFPISVYDLVLSGRLARLPWYGRFRAADHIAAQAMLVRVGLEGFAQAAFGTLSGGQAQRALIARALVSEPQILLLDEPCASVDTHAEAHIYQLLKELQGEMTIIMVTHDLNAAINEVQRVICVQRDAISLLPSEVCEHFALGLYHMPLLKRGQS